MGKMSVSPGSMVPRRAVLVAVWAMAMRASADPEGKDRGVSNSLSTIHSLTSTTLTSLSTRDIDVQVLHENGTTVTSVLGSARIYSTIPIIFGGWMVPVTSCNLVDSWGLVNQAHSRHIVAIISVSLLSTCNRLDVARIAKDKGVQALVELDVTAVDATVTLTASKTSVPWIVLRTEQELMIGSSHRTWLWLDVHILESNSATGSSAENDDTTLMFVALGFICVALTAFLVVLGTRLYSSCYKQQRIRYAVPIFFDERAHQRNAVQTAVRTDVIRMLSMMPVAPYSTIRSVHGVREDDADEPCAICLDDMSDSTQCRHLPCGHIFHAGCVDPWLIRNSTCPMCIVDLRSTFQDMQQSAVVHPVDPVGAATLQGASTPTSIDVNSEHIQVRSTEENEESSYIRIGFPAEQNDDNELPYDTDTPPSASEAFSSSATAEEQSETDFVNGFSNTLEADPDVFDDSNALGEAELDSTL